MEPLIGGLILAGLVTWLGGGFHAAKDQWEARKNKQRIKAQQVQQQLQSQASAAEIKAQFIAAYTAADGDVETLFANCPAGQEVAWHQLYYDLNHDKLQ